MKYRSFYCRAMIIALALLLHACQSSTSPIETATTNDSLPQPIQPQDDFYAYVCSEWQEAHPIPPQAARYNNFSMLQDSNKAQIRRIIQELSGQYHPIGSIQQKIADYFDIAVDTLLSEQQGIAPLIPELRAIEKIATRTQLSVQLAQLHQLGIFPFFEAYIFQDNRNSSNKILYFSQPTFNIGNRSYYLSKTPQAVEIRKAYLALIEKLFTLAGYAPAEAQRKAGILLNVESYLAQNSHSLIELQNIQKNNHPCSVGQLKRLAPGVDWNSYFAQLGLQKIDSLNVCQPQLLSATSQLFLHTSIDTLKSYLAWSVIHAASSYLCNSFLKARFEFHGKTLSGKLFTPNRWDRVYESFNQRMGEAVGQLYVERYFSQKSKKEVVKLAENLRSTFAKRIQRIEWMDDTTRAKALDKLQHLQIKIGYPDAWKDLSQLEIRSDSYWDNIKRINRYEFEKGIQSHGKAIDLNEWQMTPQTVNAYYNPLNNEICFPAAILQPPFFDPKADVSANYGAIGSIIAREMVHAFCGQGQMFDKNGNLSDWWKKTDTLAYRLKSDKVLDHFNQIVLLDTLKANGKLTLNENITDLGGISIALESLKESFPAKYTHKDSIQSLRRFFEAYALVWAENIRDEEVVRLTQTSLHSLYRWRVNGILPFIDDFYTTYDVKPQDRMYLSPEKRVIIW